MISYQAEVLLHDQMPSLATHLFEHIGIIFDVYTVRWFFSLFNIDLPFTYAQTVLDFYLCDKTEIIIRVTLAIFSVLSKKLLQVQD